MNELIPREFDGHQVRIAMIDGKPWLCAADVCAILGYANSRKAISDNCKKDGVTGSDTILTDGRKMRMIFINEGNLYRLIARSKLPAAEKFESWIFDEAIPSIMEKGSYTIPQLQHSFEIEDPIKRAERWIEEQKRLIAAEELNRKNQKKVEVFDQFLQSKNTLGLRQTAKLVGMKPKAFVDWLKENKVLYKNDTQSIMQKYVDNGWLRPSLFVQPLADGNRQRSQARVTPLGIIGLRDMAKSQGMLIEQISNEAMIKLIEEQGEPPESDLKVESDNIF